MNSLFSHNFRTLGHLVLTALILVGTVTIASAHERHLYLDEVTLHQPYDIIEEWPDFDDAETENIIPALERIQPSKDLQSLRGIYREFLTTHWDDIEYDIKNDDALAIWVARYDALMRLGFFEDVIQLQFRLSQLMGEKTPKPLTLKSAAAYAFLGQSAGVCIETLSLNQNAIKNKEIKSLYEQCLDGGIKKTNITVPKELSTDLDTGLYLLVHPQSITSDIPFVQWALSYQTELNSTKRYNTAVKATAHGAGGYERLINLAKAADDLAMEDIQSLLARGTGSMTGVERHIYIATLYHGYESVSDSNLRLRLIEKALDSMGHDGLMNDESFQLWVIPVEDLSERLNDSHISILERSHSLLNRFHFELTIENYETAIKENDRHALSMHLNECLYSEDPSVFKQCPRILKDTDKIIPKLSDDEYHRILLIMRALNYPLSGADQDLVRQLQNTKARVSLKHDIEDAYEARIDKKSDIIRVVESLNLINERFYVKNDAFNILNVLDKSKNSSYFPIFDKIMLEILLQNVL